MSNKMTSLPKFSPVYSKNATHSFNLTRRPSAPLAGLGIRTWSLHINVSCSTRSIVFYLCIQQVGTQRQTKTVTFSSC